MGSSKKKKNRAGGSRKSKGRGSFNDHSSHGVDADDLLSEEITALTAIFQDDIKVDSESDHTQIVVKLRPFSNDTGLQDFNVSALLSVRCVNGYPHKCPKLQIVSEKGLSKDDMDKLLSLLLDQANVNAREGCVMIFNLVAAAQEFLSKIAHEEQSLESVPSLAPHQKDPSVQSHGAALSDNIDKPGRPFAYGSIDLYADLCDDDGCWVGQVTKPTNNNPDSMYREKTSIIDRNRSKSMLRPSLTLDTIVDAFGHDAFENTKHHTFRGTTHGAKPFKELNVVAEDVEDDKGTSSSKNSDEPLFQKPLQDHSCSVSHEDFDLGEESSLDVYDLEGNSLSSSSFISATDVDETQSKRKDLLMVHLLQLACSSKALPSQVLSEVSSELCDMGILSEWARDLVAAPRSVFIKAFDRVFEQQMISSPVSQFWKADINIDDNKAPDHPNSRYLNDFEELRSLGRGGFGHVVLCRNKLDGRHYAVKKIRLKDKSPQVNEKILREVATLSRLQHQHVVRYYQAWFETELGDVSEGTISGSQTAASPSSSFVGGNLTDSASPNERQESTYLYIQMEYCPRTLRQDFDSHNDSFDEEYAWYLFRQIVEGLAHIHGQGIIHRDLTPSNIFFDVRNDIKIGDFGLAKFLQLEQLDHDQHLPTETTGISMDGTGQVGTYFYTAPEIEQIRPQINEKVDMYSLGVVFLELWHPFATAMERHVILSDLKQKGSPPPYWITKFPDQANLLQRLMSPSPSDRPSAIEILQHSLPPRMEDEWLNDILRTMQTAEDTYVYDRVVSTIFDEERLVMKCHHQNVGSVKIRTDESSFIQSADIDPELWDNIIEVSREIFRQHGGKRLETSSMRVLDGCRSYNRKSVKLLSCGGNMLELCYDLRTPFVMWIANNEILSFRHYEIAWVYRRAIGHSTPKHFLQGDFDIVGGAPPMTEAEVIKVSMDIATRLFYPNAIEINLNHAKIFEAVWNWIGIEGELRKNLAELLSFMGSSLPRSGSRRANWERISQQQSMKELNLPASIVNRLGTAYLRFCGPADEALARLRGALSTDKYSQKALEELSILLRYLRIWRIENYISVDVLVPPPEDYYKDLYFLMYLDENLGSMRKRILFAAGGRYDCLVHRSWNCQYKSKSSPPGAVGVSLALEKIYLQKIHLQCSLDIRPFRNESSLSVLVCSRGGGGLLAERMEVAEELWLANIKAEFVPLSDPSLTEQYEYANEHGIKCLVIITEALSQTGMIKVRHRELNKEKEVDRQFLVKFLTDALSTQFRNLSIWM